MEHIAKGTRKIQHHMVDGIAGKGDWRRTQNKKTEGRVWMKLPKISTHAERQDSQIYESNTPEILARDKNGIKGKGKGEGNPCQGHQVNCKLLEQEQARGRREVASGQPSFPHRGRLPRCGAKEKTREP